MRTWFIAVVAFDVGGSRAGPGFGRRRDVVRQMLALPRHRANATVRELGPPLNGLDGRKAGTFEGYQYSEVNKNSGIAWNDEIFANYIRNPMPEMPGTNMAFVGIRDDKEIAGLWAYLKQFKADGSK